jgi:hypothetical protein
MGRRCEDNEPCQYQNLDKEPCCYDVFNSIKIVLNPNGPRIRKRERYRKNIGFVNPDNDLIFLKDRFFLASCRNWRVQVW